MEAFFLKNYELFGVSFAGAVALFFLFKDVYQKIALNKENLEKFKEDQSKKCTEHIKDGQHNFEKVEEKIDKAIEAFNLGFTTLNNRIETLSNHIIDFFKEAKK